MASRWAAVAYEQVLCGVQNGRIGGVRSARRAVILGELPRASFTKRRIPISIKPFRFVRRSFVATDSGNPTPRCNRRPWRGVQDQADFSESLCHLSSSSLPGSRLNAIRWAACGLWTVFVWVQFVNLRSCSVHRAVIQGKRPSRLIDNRRTAISLTHSCFVRRSFVATNSGSPTPPCNRRPLSPRFY